MSAGWILLPRIDCQKVATWFIGQPQVAEWLKLHGEFSISHETIYIHLWADKRAGGDLLCGGMSSTLTL